MKFAISGHFGILQGYLRAMKTRIKNGGKVTVKNFEILEKRLKAIEAILYD